MRLTVGTLPSHSPPMSRWMRARRGVLVGALLGGGFFVADLIGASLAIGMLFDPRIESIYLVALAGFTTFVVAGVAGGVIGAVVPKPWSIRPKRRSLVAGAIIALIGVVVGGYVSRVGRRLEPPAPVTVERSPTTPVLWVVIDTLRGDTLYGERLDYPHAPRLRAFAEEAIVFVDAEAAAGWTLPAMATLFTGLHPPALEANKLLPDWAPTIAERLHAAGYTTHAIVDNALLEPRNGYSAGFETWFQKSGLRFAFSLPGFRLLGATVRRSLRELWPIYYYGAPRLTDAALAVLETHRSDALFLYVHYMDPHYPYYAHPDLRPDPESAEPVSFPSKTLRRQGGKLRPGQFEFLISRYEGEVYRVDRELGRLLDAWETAFGRRGAVLITSDHGEEFVDHGAIGHGTNLHPELVRIPLLLRLPEELLSADQHGRRIEHPVGQVDLVPTFLDAIHVAADVGAYGVTMHGQSWLPWLRGVAAAPQRALVGKQTFRGKRINRWREGDWVRIHTTDIKSNQDTVALYDKRNDQNEHHDLSVGQAERLAMFGGRMNDLIESTRAQREAGPGVARANEDALRALGYVQ